MRLIPINRLTALMNTKIFYNISYKHCIKNFQHLNMRFLTIFIMLNPFTCLEFHIFPPKICVESVKTESSIWTSLRAFTLGVFFDKSAFFSQIKSWQQFWLQIAAEGVFCCYNNSCNGSLVLCAAEMPAFEVNGEGNVGSQRRLWERDSCGISYTR